MLCGWKVALEEYMLLESNIVFPKFSNLDTQNVVKTVVVYIGGRKFNQIISDSSVASIFCCVNLNKNHYLITGKKIYAEVASTDPSR